MALVTAGKFNATVNVRRVKARRCYVAYCYVTAYCGFNYWFTGYTQPAPGGGYYVVVRRSGVITGRGVPVTQSTYGKSVGGQPGYTRYTTLAGARMALIRAVAH